MKTIQFLRNPAGVGLVEVMMAEAVTGGLTLTIAKLMENASQSAKQVEAKSENTNLKGLVQDVLNNTTACKNTFGPVMTAANITTLSASTTATITLPNIKDKLNVIKYSTASTNISPLTITSMELTNYNALAFTGDIIINSNFKKSTNNIVMVKPIRIPINFSYNAGALTACSTMAVGGEWLLGGNAGTVDETDYIGTSDNAQLNFKVNAQKSGRIDFEYGLTTFGYQAGMNSPYGSSGTAFGFQALKASTGAADGNSAFGASALSVNTTGILNTAVGWNTLSQNTSGQENTAIGSRALMYNITGNNNTALGPGGLRYATSGSYNTAIGKSLVYSTSGSANTAVGTFALLYNTSGSGNVAVGAKSLAANTTGSSNSVFGTSSLTANTSGANNVVIGAEATMANTTGYSNTAVGYQALISNTIGWGNTAIGSNSATENIGSANTFLGYNAGSDLQGGNENIYIGSNAGSGSTFSNSKLYIETASSVNPLIGGDFSSSGRFVTINNKLGIGLNIGDVPRSRLVVNGPNSPTSSGDPAYLATFYSDLPTEGMQAIHAHVNPAPPTSWTYAGFFDSSTAGVIAGKSVGVRGRSYANAVGLTGRTYGVWGMAGNATPGWNYGVYGEVIGSNAGAGIFGTANQYTDGLDTTAYRTGKLAGFFHGDVVVVGQIFAANTSIGPLGPSDRRLKKNIKPLQNSLEKILKLEGVNFD